MGKERSGFARLPFRTDALVRGLSAVLRAQPARAPTIRSRLVLVVLACVVPVSIMAAALIGYQYQRERDQLMHDSIATARAMALALDRDLTSVESALFALATSPHLRVDDLAAFDGQARQALRDQHFDNVVLSDAAGVQRINTLRPFGTPPPAPSRQPLAKRVFENGRPLVSDLIVGPVTGRQLVVVAVPVRRGDAVVYSLSAGIFPERLAKVLTQQRLPPQWIGAILDSQGTIVARTHEMDRFIGSKGSPQLVRRIAEVYEDALETTTAEGIPVISVFHRSEMSRWTVAIGIPTRSLTSALWQSIGWLVVVMVLVLAGSLGLGWAVGGRVARSVQALTRPALALGFGEAVNVPPLGLRETNEVAAALTRASRRLLQAEHQAQHDALTGLANRGLFATIVNDRIALCRRTGSPLAVLYIDLDGFKIVNDHHGHAVGDELLRAVAARLKSGLRSSDVAARLGGDEFAALLFETSAQAAGAVASKLIDSISQPYQLGAHEVTLSASIGVAGYPESGTNCEQLLQRADEAMYRAKVAGKRRYDASA
jgi:diguanylate cyclase (GGDEF)-like protein